MTKYKVGDVLVSGNGELKRKVLLSFDGVVALSIPGDFDSFGGTYTYRDLELNLYKLKKKEKTIKEWFESVENEWMREKLLDNYNVDNTHNIEESFLEALRNSFVWVDSKDGSDYWCDISVRLQKGESIEDIAKDLQPKCEYCGEPDFNHDCGGFDEPTKDLEPNRKFLVDDGINENWHENIPPQGVLCWVWDFEGSKRIITIVDEFKYYGCTYFYNNNHSGLGNRARWRNATPLTEEEVKQYILRK